MCETIHTASKQGRLLLTHWIRVLQLTYYVTLLHGHVLASVTSLSQQIKRRRREISRGIGLPVSCGASVRSPLDEGRPDGVGNQIPIVSSVRDRLSDPDSVRPVFGDSVDERQGIGGGVPTLAESDR